MTRDEAVKIVEAYEALVEMALNVTCYCPFNSSVDSDDCPHLSFDGEEAVLTWKDYESDYYGGGYLRDESFRFPVDALFLSDKQLAANQDRLNQEEAERQAKVQAARQAVARDRAEAHDRAEWARLRVKFGGA